MIFGNYPCCDGPMCLEIPDKPLPVYFREKCPYCGTPVWHKLARLDQTSWTEEGFLEEFNVDEATHKITPKETA